MTTATARGIHRRLTINATPEFVERILRRATPRPNGCLEWTGAASNKGHGRIHWQGRLYSPHCVIWVARHGQVPQGKIICHTCDNPPCVNHEHLFLGTYADNVHDMHAKRRNCLAVGADHKLATHTDADVIRVRELWVQGWSHREVMAITGFAQAFVQKVLSGEAWSHVEALRAEVESRRQEYGFINRGARKSAEAA